MGATSDSGADPTADPTADPGNGTPNPWDEVASSFQGLGMKLKYHFEQQHAAGTDAGEVQDALKRLASTIDDALDAVGAAAKDPAVRDDARKVGEALGSAFGATFSDVGEELRRLFTKRSGGA